MKNFLGLGISPQPVEPVTVAFGEWLPDMPEVDNPGAVEALNVLPGPSYYAPFKELVNQNGLVLPAQCVGAIELHTKDGVPLVYAGTSEGLYKQVANAFVKRYVPTVPLTANLYWEFIQFGDSIVALHPQQAPVVADVGGGADFLPLAGSPPIASCGARVGDFLVLGNLDNEPIDPRQPQRIRWSGFNNIEAPWISDPATQADFNDRPAEGGAVVAIMGREYGTIFQERSISRMSYVGLPTVFDFEVVEENRGAISAGAVCDIGAFVFFIAEDGFFIWNGTNTTPIGNNKVNNYFFNRLSYASRNLIVSAVDYVNQCVMWAFPTIGSGLDEIIIYSYKENKFSHSDKPVEWLLSGYSFDSNLDTMFGNLDTDFPISFDDDRYRGRRPYLAGFGVDHYMGLFTGVNRAATIDTAEYTGPGGTRVFANNAGPVVDVSQPVATIQTAGREQLRGETLVFGPAVPQEITGECPILVDARYVRFRMGLPTGADWSKAQGVELWRKSTGRR